MPDPRAWLRSLVDDENDPIRKILGEGQRLAAGIEQRLPPAVAASYRGGINMALDLDPVVGPARAAGRTRQTVEDVQQGRMKVSDAITSPLRRLNTQGRETGTVVREPISAAIARTTGIDPQAQPLGTGSFERLKAAAEAESDPLKRVLARAGLGGLDLATNVTTYIPSAKAGQGANLATKALTTGYNLTLGGFTGAGVSPAKAALQAAVLGAGAGAGEETASQLTKGNEVAKAIGALVGGGAAVTGGGLLPGKVGQAFRPAGVTGGAARIADEDVLYHGTNARFKSFRSGYNDVVWTTPTRERAKGFAEQTTYDSGKGSPRVVALRLRDKRILDATVPNSDGEKFIVDTLVDDWAVRQVETPSVGELAEIRDEIASMLRAGTGYELFDPQQHGSGTLFHAVRDAGYNALRVPDTIQGRRYGIGEAVIVLNPGDIELVRGKPGSYAVDQVTSGTSARGITEGGARGMGRVDDARLKALDARLAEPGRAIDTLLPSASEKPERFGIMTANAGFRVGRESAIGGVIGASAGAAEGIVSGDSWEEIQHKAMLGGGLGLLGGAAVRNSARIREGMNGLFAPGYNAPDGVRQAVTDHRNILREWDVHVLPLKDEARTLTMTLQPQWAVISATGQSLVKTPDKAIAQAMQQRLGGSLNLVNVMDPAVEARLLADAAAKGPAVESEMRRLIGSVPDMLEHPGDYLLTPEARQALGELRAHYDAQLVREKAAGVWDVARNTWNARATKAQQQADRLRQQINAAYARVSGTGGAAGTADKAARPYENQAAQYRRMAVDAQRMEQAALAGTATPVSGGPSVALGRMGQYQVQAATRAEQAVDATGDWFARQVEQLAARAEKVRDTAGVAGTSGQARTALAAARNEAAAQRAIDAFTARASSVPSIAAGQRYDRALVRLRGAISSIATRSVTDAEPLLRGFDQVVTRADGLYQQAFLLSRANNPTQAARRLAQMQTALDAAGVQAARAVAQAGAMGARQVVQDARGFAAMARVATVQAARMDARAQAVRQQAYLAVGREMVKFGRQQARQQRIADEMWRRIQRPVQEYAPHYWLRDPNVAQFGSGTSVTVGGKAAFQNERSYLDYRAGVLDGAVPASLDAGDLVEARLTKGARTLADQRVVRELVAEMRRPEPGIVPAFMRDTLPNPDDYVPLRDIIVRLGNKDEQRGLLAQLAARTPLPPGLSKQQQASLRAQINQGNVQYYVRKSIARELDAYFKPYEPEGIAAFVQNLFGGLREAVLGFDLAMTLRMGPQSAGFLLAQNPTHLLANTSAMWRAYTKVVSPAAYERWLRTPQAQRWARYFTLAPEADNAILEQSLKQGPLRRGAESLKARGGAAKLAGQAGGAALRPGEALERWQFGRFIPTLGVEMAEAMWNGGLGQKYLARGMSEDAVRAAISKMVGQSLGAFDTVPAGLSRQRMAAERMLMLSPSITRSLSSMVMAAGKGGIEGEMARRFWIGSAALGVATTAALTLLLSGDIADPEERATFLQRKFDPRSDEVIWVPGKRDFLYFELPGDKGRATVFAPLRPVANVVFGPLVKAAEKGIEAGTEQAQRDSLAIAVKAGIAAAIDALPGQEKDAALKWLWSRASLPISMGTHIKENEDWRGMAITTKTDDWDRTMDMLKFIGFSALPGIVSNALDDDRTALPEGVQTPSSAAFTVGLGALGANVVPASQDPAPVKRKVESFLDARGLHGGTDPVGAYRKADLSRRERDTFEADNPDVAQWIAAKRQEKGAQIDRGNERTQLERYTAAVNEETAIRNRAFADAAARMSRREPGYGGAEYKRDWDAAWERYINTVDGLAWEHLRASTRDEVQQAQTRVYGARKPVDEIEELYDRYNSIRAADNTTVALEAMLDARAQFLESLPADQREQLKAAMREHARRIGGETAADLWDAQQIMAQRARMPLYLGMTLEQSRQVAKALQRAKDRLKFGMFGPVTTGMLEAAIFTDPATPGNIRGMAAFAASGKLDNPMRAMFLRQPQHAKAAAFYSDLVYEDVQRLIARAE